MGAGWMLLGAFLAFGGGEELSQGTHAREPVKPLRQEFAVSSGEKSTGGGSPAPGIGRIYFSFRQAPQLGSWSFWGLRRHFPWLNPVLVRLRMNADIVKECFSWVNGFYKARKESPAFDLAWRGLQVYSGSKFLRVVEGLGFFDVSFCYGGAIGFSLESEWKDGKRHPHYQQGGSCYYRHIFSLSYESRPATGGKERFEYRRIKSFRPRACRRGQDEDMGQEVPGAGQGD